MVASRNWRELWPRVLAHQFRSYYFVRPPKWRVKLRAIGADKRVKPHFASIGAVRSGTSKLSSYIFQHPQVVLPLAKEVDGVYKLKDLLAHFPRQRSLRRTERALGKAITGYCSPIVPSLLWVYTAKAVCPEAKLVIILRDPVERTHSHWKWDQFLLGSVLPDPVWTENPTFDEIVAIELAAMRSGGAGFDTISGAGFGYLRHSIYAPFLRELFKHYPREQVHIVDATRFFAEPRAVMDEVFAFLGLDPIELVLTDELNSGAPGKMSPETRAELAGFFRPYNEELFELLGRRFDWEKDALPA